MQRPSRVFPKTYLGDSVYAELDQFGSIVLTTENGRGPSNRIILEHEVFEALEQWYKQDESAQCICHEDFTDGTPICQQCHKERR